MSPAWLHNPPHTAEMILPAQSVTADVTPTTTGGTDITAYDGVLVFVQTCKNTAGTTPTLTNTLVHRDEGGTFEVVSGGAFAQVTDADTAAAVVEVLTIDKNRLKKYVDVKRDIGGTGSPAFMTAVTMLGHKKYDPPTEPAA